MIGSVVERSTGSGTHSAPRNGGSGKTGFPSVQHRSKSAFARGREELKRKGTDRPTEVPIVKPSQAIGQGGGEGNVTGKVPPQPASEEDWRRQIDEENKKRVESMTDEEREQERQDILEKFGSGVGDILRKAREARERKSRETEATPEAGPSSTIGLAPKVSDPIAPSSENTPEGGAVEDSLSAVKAALQRAPLELRHPRAVHSILSPVSPSTPRSALSRPNTRPSSRADRRLRFADVTPQDVYVYESAPPSPKKRPLALLAPTDADQSGGDIVSLGQWKPRTPLQASTIPVPDQEMVDTEVDTNPPSEDPEEGTPEDIRRRFFPGVAPHDPSLEWIESSAEVDPASLPSTSSNALRFDLTGTPIPPELSSTLPTHLGLHHHAEGSHAGYTLDDIFLLSRSTVPAQRASMLGLLARIARKLGKGRRAAHRDEGIKELFGQETELRKRIVASGAEAIGERGSVGAMAVEIFWECIVGWDDNLADIEGVEFSESLSEGSEGPVTSDALPSLPLDYLLPQISDAIGLAALPSAFLSQLVDILHRLAQNSNDMAESILGTADLIPNIIRTFIATPLPPSESSPLPNPSAIQLLTTLALASRSNASALLEPADVLLRFIATSPSSSPFPHPLATSLLASSLEFYAVLASYGLYSHIVTTAWEPFARMSVFIQSSECKSSRLIQAWASLLEAWMVCAADPHETTPSHDILWSQVVGWAWATEVSGLQSRSIELSVHGGSERRNWEVWASLWRAEAAFLEGARLNGVRGGEEERLAAVGTLKDRFNDGFEGQVLLGSLQSFNTALHQQTSYVDWDVDIHQLKTLASLGTTIASALRLWLACTPPSSNGPLTSPPFPLPFALLADMSAEIAKHPIWSAIYGENAPPYAHLYCRPLATLLLCYLRVSRRMPATGQDLWLAQAFTVLQRLLPGDEAGGRRVLKEVAKLITPEFFRSRSWNIPPVIWDKGGMDIILPFLLHSIAPSEKDHIGPFWATPRSISQVSTQRLPSASAIRSRKGSLYGLPLSPDWCLSPLDHLLRSGSSPVFKKLPSSWDASETEVARVTLLFTRVVREVLIRQRLLQFSMNREETIFGCMKVFMLEHEQPQNDSSEEVFRDVIVTAFMNDLLDPFTLSASSPIPIQSNLEAVAVRFLGPSTPFFQYYTDFIALYDSISFSHPLFAALLLPPLSMRYALDYRKHFWGDFSHVLKTVRIPVDRAITGDVREYLWPIESDSQVIGSYLGAVLKGSLQGFVRWIAIHHLACNIWPDLRGNHEGEERAVKLLRAVGDQGDIQTVREVVFYQQVSEGPALIPPHCFEADVDSRKVREEWVGRVEGDLAKVLTLLRS
ncbi:hypothetical protein JAAARDRAFT_30030 [Jaapia argillacea MUCL 33604]|uniref:RNA polymerase II-associated protein 1 C-terminal domain-containing protein n=1 Tax=Jaapia argillacea MUCL 33604 TaxID=933084 RepID=A0A067Q4Z2_9AGAM|nr:hypothetical protein JAAARDRAFT_30030 [Jaapia argillacea MUCL 33604]